MTCRCVSTATAGSDAPSKGPTDDFMSPLMIMAPGDFREAPEKGPTARPEFYLGMPETRHTGMNNGII